MKLLCRLPNLLAAKTGIAFLLLAAPLVAFSDETKVQMNGHIRLRSEGNLFNDYSSTREFFLLKARPVFKISRGEQFTAVLAPQFARTLGEPSYLTPVNTGLATKSTLSGTTADPYLYMHEANLQFALNPWLSFKGGRIILSYGDEIVLGALEWNNVGRAFDGFIANAKFDSVHSDIFYTKVVDNNTLASGASDSDFFGTHNSLDLGEALKTLDLYLYDQRNASSHLGVFGVRAASNLESFDYRIEGTQEFGNRISKLAKAIQLDGEVGKRFDGDVKPRIGLGYFWSGAQYDQLYPTAHKWLGYADVLGRRNITGPRLRLDGKVASNLKLMLDYHHFIRADNSAAVYKLNGSTVLGAAAGSTSNTVGDELDFTFNFSFSADLQISGGASYFLAGKYLKDQLGNRNPVFYFTAMEAKF